MRRAVMAGDLLGISNANHNDPDHSGVSALRAADVSEARVPMGVKSFGISHAGDVTISLAVLPCW